MRHSDLVKKCKIEECEKTVLHPRVMCDHHRKLAHAAAQAKYRAKNQDKCLATVRRIKASEPAKKEPRRCAVEGCITFLRGMQKKYCAAHESESSRGGRCRPRTGKPAGGRNSGTTDNPLRGESFGKMRQKINDVGLMDHDGERQILNGVYGN